jgi:hypothetical protein
MWSIKPGRGPSAMGAMGSAIGIVFGIFWTILAFSITREAPFAAIRIIFPLFGVAFIITGVISLIYNLNNAVSPNRFSAFDVTRPDEESDPLQQRFSNPQTLHGPHVASSAGTRKHPGEFCPFCGAQVSADFNFCPKCGKNI